jgi:hypothetical protein
MHHPLRRVVLVFRSLIRNKVGCGFIKIELLAVRRWTMDRDKVFPGSRDIQDIFKKNVMLWSRKSCMTNVVDIHT